MTLCALLTLCGCQRKPVEGGETPHIPPSLTERFYPPVGWAWGKLKVEGAPMVRYGVAAPGRSARGEVLILPDAGEPAEGWFETANDLVDRGYVVWILDWPGQGGSGRWEGTEDRLYAKSLDPDVAAVRRLLDEVVRPKGRAPLVLVGDGLGGQLALRALSSGTPDVAGAVVGAPALAARSTRLARPFGDWGADLAGRIGFGRPFVAGEHSWAAPEHIPPGRAGAVDAWMKANPDLRIGGASLAWTAAYNRSVAAARDPVALKRISIPVLMLADGKDGAARDACFEVRSCRFLAAAGGPPHRADDRARGLWLDETDRFVAAQALGRGYVIAAPPIAQSSPSGGSGPRGPKGARCRSP